MTERCPRCLSVIWSGLWHDCLGNRMQNDRRSLIKDQTTLPVRDTRQDHRDWTSEDLKQELTPWLPRS